MQQRSRTDQCKIFMIYLKILITKKIYAVKMGLILSETNLHLFDNSFSTLNWHVTRTPNGVKIYKIKETIKVECHIFCIIYIL